MSKPVGLPTSNGTLMTTPADTPPDAWHNLRAYTAARIGIGRAGGSLPTRELLEFSLAHASARDAVHDLMNSALLSQQLRDLGYEVTELASDVENRQEYLQRPDKGRKLSSSSREHLVSFAARNGFSQESKSDLAIVVSDGLSARACHEQVPEFLKLFQSCIQDEKWRLAPVCIVEQGRVAIQDEIGEILHARCSVILLGERPGLGSPDSLGAYLIYHPRVGSTDADRNCLSNIRPAGLPLALAADTLHYLLNEALKRRLSGVSLKDDRQFTLNRESTRNLPGH